MVLLIDNYDSFSFNLYQYIGEIDRDIKVIRNDEKTPEEIIEMLPDHIIISPGPGRPSDAGCIIELIKKAGKTIPILGVCLGHQAICEAYGAKITYAKKLMHGKQSRIKVDNTCRLFADCPDYINVARYHSLAADKETIPEELKVTAVDEDGEIMAVMHKRSPVFGVQFHPESVMTPEGKEIIKNFLRRNAS